LFVCIGFFTAPKNPHLNGLSSRNELLNSIFVSVAMVTCSLSNIYCRLSVSAETRFGFPYAYILVKTYKLSASYLIFRYSCLQLARFLSGILNANSMYRCVLFALPAAFSLFFGWGYIRFFLSKVYLVLKYKHEIVWDFG